MDQSQTQETQKKPSDTNGSRASSARSSRTGSVRKDADAQLNFSSARQRRFSNNSQRSSPRPDLKQSNSSSVFNALSQRDDGDPEAFFTDQDYIRSVNVNDDEWNETRQWVDELHRLNSSFTTNERSVPLAMTNDSLAATTDKNDERFLPIFVDSTNEKAATRIQRWYRKKRQTPKKIAKEPSTNDRRPPTPPPSRLASSTAGSQNSTKNRASPTVRTSVTSVTSKITYDDVCEALKKLEEVEQFPVQPVLKDDAIYLNVESFSDTSSLSECSTPRNDRQPSRTSTPRSAPKIVGPASSVVVLPNTPKEKDLLNRNVRSTQDLREKLKQWKSQDRRDDFQHQLDVQKEAYQKSIEQHIRFLDEVNEDKKKLVARCQTLENQIKTLERSHRLEIQRFKDTQAAAEKSRREKWIEDKSRKFRELTVENLEPEIQKLIDKYQKEIEDLKETHRIELNLVDVKASERYIRLTDELREELQREKHEAVARERELAREKYEKAIRDERENFVEQRKKLFAEIEEEKSRQTNFIAKQRAELDKLRRDFEEQKQNLTNEIEDRLKLVKENAERQVTQLEKTLAETRTSRDRFEKLVEEKTRENEKLENSIRQEMAERLSTVENANRQLQIDLENKNDEIQQLKTRQERELATLQEKIQQAVVKKDEQVAELRRQYETVLKRAEHLESSRRKATKNST